MLAVLYTVALIAGAIGLIVVSSILLPGLGRAMRPPGPEQAGLPPSGDLAPFENNLYLTLSLSLLNVALAIYILYVYVKDYLSLRSSFTLGMVAFLFSFLLYALSSSPMMHMVFGPYGIASKLSFVPMLFSAICLIIFTKLSNE
jgi:hypothetical protein